MINGLNVLLVGPLNIANNIIPTNCVITIIDSLYNMYNSYNSIKIVQNNNNPTNVDQMYKSLDRSSTRILRLPNLIIELSRLARIVLAPLVNLPFVAPLAALNAQIIDPNNNNIYLQNLDQMIDIIPNIH